MRGLPSRHEEKTNAMQGLHSLADKGTVLAFEQGGAGAQEFIYLPRAFAAFTDRPHYKGLAPAHISCGEYLGDIRLILFL